MHLEPCLIAASAGSILWRASEMCVARWIMNNFLLRQVVRLGDLGLCVQISHVSFCSLFRPPRLPPAPCPCLPCFLLLAVGSYAVVHSPQGSTCLQGTPIENGQRLRLQHASTRRWLHSHHFPSPLTNNQEVRLKL